MQLLNSYRIETRCPNCNAYHELYAPGTAAQIWCYACHGVFGARFQGDPLGYIDDYRGSRV